MRYYCIGEAGPAGHCTDRGDAVQCEHCEWTEREVKSHPNHPTNMYLEKVKEIPDYLTNPAHGGKVTCHKCNRYIIKSDAVVAHCYQNAREFPAAHFHRGCYNEYEHYYGLDRPID